MILAELFDGCNLKCSLCPTRFREQSMKHMELSKVEKILKKYSNQWIHWFNWGEPLLHKDFLTIADMVVGSSSRVSTNLSLKLTDEYFKALRKFRMVIVSLSGMTQEIYEINHRGGNFELVMSNLDILLSDRRNPKDTCIHWLSHKYNEFQLPLIEEYCKNKGVNWIKYPLGCTIEELVEGFDHELLQTPKFKRVRSKCRIMNWTPIDVDGNYLLCCVSQNVKIGYTIDDDVTPSELVQARMKTDLCTLCREKSLWRMFS